MREGGDEREREGSRRGRREGGDGGFSCQTSLMEYSHGWFLDISARCQV